MLNEIQILALLNMPGIGKKTVLKLIKGFSNVASDQDLFDELENIGKLKFLTFSSLLRYLEEANDKIELMKREEVNIVGFSNTLFPILLKENPRCTTITLL
ncbi:MAG: hypothetical protein IPJ75_09590 [Ignavibacteriales bacterium]|nr:hypothetical protein [Ignavibacteriales bacterium]